MSIFHKGKRFVQRKFLKEEELETKVFDNYKTLFGEKAILINAKRRITAGELGKTVPDGFLFDFSDDQNPKFYLVEIELAKHHFWSHIFKQITQFFAFLRDGNIAQSELIEKLFIKINGDEALKREFKSRIGDQELFKFIKDTVEDSKDILIVIDEDKPEFQEIQETYTDTWDKFVRILILKEFTNNGESILTLEPDLESFATEVDSDNHDFVADDENSEESDIVTAKKKYTEAFHLDSVSTTINGIYSAIKERFPKFYYNPQRYYISIKNPRNFAFMIFRKNKIELVIMLTKSELEKHIKHHSVITLSAGVQQFYGASCASVIIDSPDHIQEIFKALESASTAKLERFNKAG